MQAQGMTRRAFVTLGATALAMGLFGCGGKAEPEADGGTHATAEAPRPRLSRAAGRSTPTCR